MDKQKDRLFVFSGTANPALAESICAYLGVPHAKATVARFPDLEVDVKIHEDVRGCDAFVVQPTCTPANENLMELLILVDCLRRASARRITAVMPYYGYGRKDRKDEGRVPITSKLVANLITTAGAHRVLALDLHASQIQGFFDIPMDHLYAFPVFSRYLKDLALPNLAIVAPDIGSLKMNRAYATALGATLAFIDKRRISASETVVLDIVGKVEGKNVVMVDDMIATGGSIVEAARLVKKLGAKQVHVLATHAVLAGNAVSKLNSLEVEKYIFTDTIPLGEKKIDNCEVLTIAPLLGEAIRRIHDSESVSFLFDVNYATIQKNCEKG
jgi:ribose-phosphate pyrophosphokinase